MDIAIVVNLRARRGSQRVAEACREEMPGANIMVSNTLDEALGFAKRLQDAPPSLLVSAGGDGTADAIRDRRLVEDAPVGGGDDRSGGGGPRVAAGAAVHVDDDLHGGQSSCRCSRR